MSVAATERSLGLDGVSLGYGADPVVRDVDLSVAPGELHALLGESGSGKTTLLRGIAGFQRALAGSIEVGGVVVDRSGQRRAFVPPERRRVGVVFQDYALFPHLDVEKNVAFGLPVGASPDAPARLLEKVGLGGYAARGVGELSGGEQQRVALARALAQSPHVILLDEPFSNLNRELRARLRTETAAIVREAGIAAVLVTHDPSEAFAFADRISVVHEGALLATGGPRDLYDAPSSLQVAQALGHVIRLPGRVVAGALEGPLRGVSLASTDATGAPRGVAYIRPEQLLVEAELDADPGEVWSVANRRFLGAEVELHLASGAGEYLSVPVPSHAVAATADRVRLSVRGEAMVFPEA